MFCCKIKTQKERSKESKFLLLTSNSKNLTYSLTLLAALILLTLEPVISYDKHCIETEGMLQLLSIIIFVRPRIPIHCS